jgi:hypothetical protein
MRPGAKDFGIWQRYKTPEFIMQIQNPDPDSKLMRRHRICIRMTRRQIQNSTEKNLKTSVRDPDHLQLGQVVSESGSESKKIVPDLDLRTDSIILIFDIKICIIFAYFTSKSKITYPLENLILL